MRGTLSQAEQTVLALLEAAAEGEQPCPKNEALAEAIGARSIATASHLVAALEARGLITVARTRRTRVVTIVASGASTAEVNLQTGPQRASELAQLVSENKSLAEAARTMGLSIQRVHQIWAEIRRQLGPQAC